MRSVTLVRGQHLPFSPKPRERLLLGGQFGDYLSQGRRRFPAADTAEFSYYPFYTSLPQERSRIRKRAAGDDRVIFCLANYNSLEVLQELAGLGPRVVVISALSPVYLGEVPWVRTAVAVYGTGPASFAAGFAVLAGDFAPEGRLPFELPPPGALPGLQTDAP